MSRNPPAIPHDTSPDVWHRQMAAIAARTPAERRAEWEAHNEAVAKMEADGVRRRHPTYTEREVFLALVRHRYGDDTYRAAWPGEPLLAP